MDLPVNSHEPPSNLPGSLPSQALAHPHPRALARRPYSLAHPRPRILASSHPRVAHPVILAFPHPRALLPVPTTTRRMTMMSTSIQQCVKSTKIGGGLPCFGLETLNCLEHY